MATNGDEMDVVEPDWWLEMERRQIDALGPKFEALVDTVMREMGGEPEKRDEVRRSLYHDLQAFGNQAGLYQEIDNAKPREWLKRVHRAAKALKELLDDVSDGWLKPDAEWADSGGTPSGRGSDRLAGDVSAPGGGHEGTRVICADQTAAAGIRRFTDSSPTSLRLTSGTLGRKLAEAVGVVAVLTKARRRRAGRFFGS